VDIDSLHPSTLTANLAAYLRRRPGQWINAKEFFPIAGSFGWRSRLSDCRQQYGMRIVNRQQRIAPDPMQPTKKIIVTEYQFQPDRPAQQMTLEEAAGAEDASCRP
jgi:hypothetical protein